MAADSLTANKETTKAATKIVKIPLLHLPRLGGEKRGGVKNYESGTVGRIENRPYSSMRSSRWLPPQCFSKSRLFFLIQPVDVTALIQLAAKSHVDEILWLGCLPFSFSSQNRFQSFERRVLLPRQHRLIEEVFIALLEDIALYFAAEIFP